MLEVLEAEQPDLIVITGDSINVTSNYPGLRDVLAQMHAALGVWVVRGNHEDWWPVENEQEFYESAGTKLLLNSSRQVCEGVWLVGFDDLYGGTPDADKAFAGVPKSAYKIALFHSPPLKLQRDVVTSHLRVTRTVGKCAPCRWTALAAAVFREVRCRLV
jgi:predicted MPP superfamily phosphohydrolase